MKYNEKYDRYVTKGGLVYRYSKKQDKLILCKFSDRGNGYKQVYVITPKRTYVSVHRLVYETFVGEIPEGMVIDHINTIKDDNSLSNLRLCTQKENLHNPITLQKRKYLTWSEFGMKFKNHFGISFYENKKLYDTEHHWYIRHNKVCRWEVK